MESSTFFELMHPLIFLFKILHHRALTFLIWFFTSSCIETDTVKTVNNTERVRSQRLAINMARYRVRYRPRKSARVIGALVSCHCLVCCDDVMGELSALHSVFISIFLLESRSTSCIFTFCIMCSVFIHLHFKLFYLIYSSLYFIYNSQCNRGISWSMMERIFFDEDIRNLFKS